VQKLSAVVSRVTYGDGSEKVRVNKQGTDHCTVLIVRNYRLLFLNWC